MTITPGKYRTRSGKNVTVVQTDLKSFYLVLGYVHHENIDSVSQWCSDGRFFPNCEHACDLVERLRETV